MKVVCLEIIKAKNIGFCFGVSRAVEIAIKSSEKYSGIVTFGDLIHNSQVVEHLRKKGVTSIDNINQLEGVNQLIIRSHGVKPEIYDECTKMGIELIDATCPYVSRIQQKAKYCLEQNIPLIIFGEAAHPEIIGINGWNDNNAIIITGIKQAKNLKKFKKAVIAAQTTAHRQLWNEIIAIVNKKVDDLDVFDSICESTCLRQTEAADISKQVDMVLVIGGKHSSNTKKLYTICNNNCNITYHVETIDEIKSIDFTNIDTVGIISGASTPDWIIKEGITAMSDLNEATKKCDEQDKNKEEVLVKGKTKEKVDKKVKEKRKAKSKVSDMKKEETKALEAETTEEEVLKAEATETKTQKEESKEAEAVEVKPLDAKTPEVASAEIKTPEEDVPVEEEAVEIESRKAQAQEAEDVESEKLKVDETKSPKEEIIDAEALVAEASKETVESETTDAEDSQPEEDEKKLQESFMEDIEKSMVTIKTGMIVKGKVVTVNEEEVCVNIGYKADGIVTKQEFSSDQDVKLTEAVKEGDEFEVEVLRVRDEDGNVLLSRKNVESRKHWQALLDTYEEQEYYECIGKQVVKGGLIATINGIRAFIPASHLDIRYVNDITEYVGKQMKVKIIEIEKHRHRVVASRKQYILDEEKRTKDQIWDAIEEGSTVRGIVRRLTDFGAFVDIGGIDGLVHVTDLAWGRVNHPKDIVSTNQEIDVVVLKVDKSRERISLGYKQTLPRPWDVADEKYPIGSVITGKVVRIVPFGAFIELEPGLDGLIHISQVSNKRIEKVEDVLELKQEVQVKVLDLNTETRRISLSIRAIIEPEDNDSNEKNEEASSVLVDTSQYE